MPGYARAMNPLAAGVVDTVSILDSLQYLGGVRSEIRQGLHVLLKPFLRQFPARYDVERMIRVRFSDFP